MNLFGVDQSPWVQGVLSCLAYHNIPVKLSCRPTRLSSILFNGITIPVLTHNDKIIRDSFLIYEYIQREISDIGLNKIDHQYVINFQFELEKLFLKYSLGRCGNGRNIQFFCTWSNIHEINPSFRSDIFRVLLSIYFFFLILIGRLIIRIKGKRPYDLNIIKCDLSNWDRLLSEKKFFSGDDIGVLDFAFFGHVECMASGLTDELLPLFRQFPNLMRWLIVMHDKNPDYGPMYSKRIISFSPVKKNSTRFYWPILFLSFICCPITILLNFWFFALRFRGNNYSGAKIRSGKF